jgi:hypothetical protein
MITIEAVEANIASEHYFTLADGVCGAAWRTVSDARSQEPPERLKTHTVCVLILKNGFTVTGESACIDPATFNDAVGRKIARDNALERVWPLMGYALMEASNDR